MDNYEKKIIRKGFNSLDSRNTNKAKSANRAAKRRAKKIATKLAFTDWN